MRKLLYFCILSIFIFSFNACNDPVFYQISQEVKPIPPLIKGSPTKLVELKDAGGNDMMYVASGQSLFWYDGSNWPLKEERIYFPGRVYDLESTDDHLYALYMDSSRRYLKKFDKSRNELDFPSTLYSSYRFWSLFSVGNHLFIGASQIGSSSTYCIVYYDGANFIKLKDTDNKLLRGAATDGSTIFLCTKDQQTRNGGAIYKTDLTPAGTVIINDIIRPFMGIISLPDNTVVAIERSGLLSTVTDSDIFDNEERYRFAGRFLSNGVLAIYITPDDEYILLAGRQDSLNYTTTSGYTYGYLELLFDEDGALFDITLPQFSDPEDPDFINIRFREPGTITPSTVRNNARFKSTIGKNPLIDLRQFKDLNSHASDNLTLFASTALNGVWSYAYHGTSDGVHWNAERNRNF